MTRSVTTVTRYHLEVIWVPTKVHCLNQWALITHVMVPKHPLTQPSLGTKHKGGGLDRASRVGSDEWGTGPVMDASTAFGPLTIAFDNRVLHPRGWTAAQSRWARSLLPSLPDGHVLELCSGAGQIGLLAVAETTRQLVCVDADAIACDFARANAESAGLAARVEVRHARLEDALDPGETFPLIIADPPWVPRRDTGQFPEDPITAIDGGEDGLDVARSCLAVIRRHLAPGGSALLQLGTSTQVDMLAAGGGSLLGLDVVEVRQHERGVLVRLDHPRDTGR